MADSKNNLAISYAVQRKNKKSKGGLVRGDAGMATADKMQYADGGMVRAGSEKPTADTDQEHLCTTECYSQGGEVMCVNSKAEADANPGTPAAKSDNMRPATEDFMGDTGPADPGKGYAEGGMIAEEMPAEEELRAGAKSVYDMLRHKARFAKGGMAGDRPDDLDDSDVEHGNVEDDLSFETLGKMLYDTAQISKQPSDSNETGDSEESGRENDRDSSILGKIKKRGMKKIGSGEGME